MAGHWAENTVRGETHAPEEDAPRADHLFLVLECDRPLASGARAELSGVDEITFGRGRTRGFQRTRRTLEVTVPDQKMSSRHARLSRVEAGWLFEDQGSTNGSRIWGEVTARSLLEEGALLELGTTLFTIRKGLATPSGLPLFDDTERSPDSGRVRGLTTVLPADALANAALARVATSGVSVLLLGESGTGKEVLARAVHELSKRGGPFVPVNCGALPETLVEGQLFGHVKGAFSGAVRDEAGFVRASHGGTLFLDEIGDLPKSSQAALLRVLQEREVTPVGSTRAYPVDLRVIAATHRPIDAFRSDLYARLAGFAHALKPLRERREDLGILIADLLPRVARGGGAQRAIGTDLARALYRYEWPLNIRELEQALTVATVLAEGALRLAHAPTTLQQLGTGRSSVAPPPNPASPPRAEVRSEDDARLRDELLCSLREHKGNVSHVAKALGKTRMQIHRWMQRFSVDAEKFRA